MICVTCPTCGGHLGELPEPEKVRTCLSPQELSLFDVLLKAGPEGIARVDLSIALHGKTKGASERSMNQTSMLVSRIRRKLDQYGYHIQRNPPLKHGVYRIIPEVACS